MSPKDFNGVRKGQKPNHNWFEKTYCQASKIFFIPLVCAVQTASMNSKKYIWFIHIARKHPRDLEKIDCSVRTNASKRKADEEESNGLISIYKRKSKIQRTEMLVKSIPGYIESKTPLSFYSEKAQELHKYLFEMLVIDSEPWSMVNNPGFLRYSKKMCPNFVIDPPQWCLQVKSGASPPICGNPVLGVEERA